MNSIQFKSESVLSLVNLWRKVSAEVKLEQKNIEQLFGNFISLRY